MDIGPIIPCTYVPGELRAYTFIRGGRGWDCHQGPSLHSFCDERLFMCWGAYDIQECSNDGVVLYSLSRDQGETWSDPQVFMAGPHAVVSHLQFAELGDGGALMAYREGHYRGAQEDRRRKVTVGWAKYGESRMHLLVRRSPDGGLTWGPPVALDPVQVVGADRPPFYGSPEQLLRLADGDLLLSVVYLDPDHRDPQHFNMAVLRSQDQGLTWTRTADMTVPEPRGAMEPSMAEVEPGVLHCVIRNKSGFLYATRSGDGGRTWSTPARTDIPTVEAMARLLLLEGGRLMMVWNNASSTTQRPRHPLVAALSRDGGLTWDTPRILGDDVGDNQLSNFNHIQTRDGRILVCTSHYRAQPPPSSDLDLLVFDEAWLRK